MSTNPFSNPYPIKQPAKLFGRERLVKHIVERALGADYQVSQSILGLTRSGKTSVLNCVASLGDSLVRDFMVAHFRLDVEHLTDLNRVVFVQVNCLGMSDDTAAAFWDLVGSKLRENVGTKEPPLVAGLLGTRHLSYNDVCAILQGVARTRLLVAILFDEFDRVTINLPGQVLDALRYFSDEFSGHIVYVTATRRRWGYDFRALQDAADRGARLATGRNGGSVTSAPRTYFDNHPARISAPHPAVSRVQTQPPMEQREPVIVPGYVGLLEPGGVQGYIHTVTRLQNVPFTDADMNFVLSVGGRHPDLTRMVCERLYEARAHAGSGNVDYDVVYSQVLLQFESLYNSLWPEVDAFWQSALLQATRGERCNLLDSDIELLGALGLIVPKGPTAFTLFSPVFEDFLQREHNGVLPKRTNTKWHTAGGKRNENRVYDATHRQGPDPRRGSTKNRVASLWRRPSRPQARRARLQLPAPWQPPSGWNPRRWALDFGLTRSFDDMEIYRRRKQVGGKPGRHPLLFTVALILSALGLYFAHPATHQTASGIYGSVWAVSPSDAIILLTIDFVAVGIVAWQVLKFARYRAETRRRTRRLLRGTPNFWSVAGDKPRKRDVIWDLIVGCLAGVISTLVATLILRLL